MAKIIDFRKVNMRSNKTMFNDDMAASIFTFQPPAPSTGVKDKSAVNTRHLTGRRHGKSHAIGSRNFI